MALTRGTRLGPYEIVGVAGSGGMGEVYRARDTRLDRTVAIKLLPAQLAADAQFRERLDREARAISQLTHPNICTLYDVGDSPAGEPHGAATRFLVMEYLEGETLAARIARSRLAPAEALRVAGEIASAMDHAHRHGLVHRDLKPGNVMLTKSGAKLLDFGLAKGTSAGGAVVDVGSASMPTMVAPLTAEGTILGTVQYMAPEQIEGRPVDARTDIFAFGVLLYEMLAGRPPFTGSSPASVLGAILKDEPLPLTQVLPTASPALDHLVRTCLAKDPDDRFQTARDVWIEVKWVAESSGTSSVAAGVHQAGNRRERIVWWIATVALAVAAGAAGWLLRRVPEQLRPVTRLEYPLPPNQHFTDGGRRIVAISPDGTKIAYIANRQLYLRHLDRLDSQALIGADEYPIEPVFSPDGKWIAYFSLPPGVDATELRKVAVTGGASVTLGSTIGRPYGATWQDNQIVFGHNGGDSFGIQAIVDGGGTARTLVSVDGNTERAVQPQLLDDRQHVLFAMPPPSAINRPTGTAEGPIVVQAIGGSGRKVLVPLGLHPRVLPTGHLTYFHNGMLFAVAYDASRQTISGDTMPLGEDIPQSNVSSVAQFAISQNGTLAYGQGVPSGTSFQLVVVDRRGTERPLPLPPSRYQQPRLSPDGSRLAVSAAGQILTWSFANETPMRITSGDGRTHFNAAWMGNSHLVYDSAGESAGTAPSIVRRSADGAGADEAMVPAPAGYPNFVTPDGRFLIYHLAEHSAMLVPLQPRGEVRPLLPDVKGQVSDVELSPDRRWIAFQSNESGRFEIYVRPFPAVNTGRWIISANGGQHPVWSRNGRELFFIGGDGMMMAVPVVSEAATFKYGRPVPLFPAGHYFVNVARNYDVTPDGKGFIVVKSSTTERQSIVVVTNWFEEIRSKMSSTAR